jgi:hypothetical protein
MSIGGKFAIAVLAAGLLSGEAQAAPSVSLTAVRKAYVNSAGNALRRKLQKTFIKLSGPALKEYGDQKKWGADSEGHTTVYKLPGSSALARTTRLIATEGDGGGSYALVKVDRTGKGASSVLAHATANDPGYPIVWSK